jgi:hypothetical protein
MLTQQNADTIPSTFESFRRSWSLSVAAFHYTVFPAFWNRLVLIGTPSDPTHWSFARNGSAGRGKEVEEEEKGLKSKREGGGASD